MSDPGGTIDVRIRAQVDELQSGANAARAGLETVRVSAEDLRAALAATGNDLNKAGALLLNTASGAKTLETATAAAAGSTKVLAGNTSIAARELRALFDEISTGRTQYLPSTLAILGQRVLGLSPAALVAVGAFAALTAGLIYFQVEAARTADRLNSLDLLAGMTGKLDITRQDIQEFISNLDYFSNVTEKDATAAAASLIRIPQLSEPAFRSFSGVLAQFSAGSMLPLKTVTEEVTRIMDSESVKVAQLQRLFPNITQAQVNAAEAASQMGDKNKLAVVLVDLMSDSIRANEQALVRQDTAMLASTSNLIAYLETLGIAPLMEKQQTYLVDSETEAIKKRNAALLDAMAKLTALAHSPKGSPLSDLPNEMEQARLRISQLDAAWSGSISGRYAAEAKVWQQLLSGDKLNQEQRLEVQRDLDMAIAHEHSSLVTEDRTARREEVAAARQAATEQREITADQYRTELEVARITIDQKKEMLQQEVDEGIITKQQMLSEMKAITQEEYADALAEATKEQALYKDNAVQYAHYTDQIRILRAQLAAALASIDQQIAAADNKTARGDAQSWKTAAGEIMSAEDDLVRNILSGRQNLWGVLATGALNFATKEIEADLKYYTAHLIYSQAELAADKALGQQGLLLHLLFGEQKAASDAQINATTSATKIAATATDIAASKADALATIPVDAALTFAGVFANLAPVMGPLAAGPAAASEGLVLAQLAVASAAGGMWDVPGGLFILHPEESVLPASIANPMRNFFEHGAQGGQTVINIHALDAYSVRQLFMSQGSALVAALNNERRNLNPGMQWGPF